MHKVEEFAKGFEYEGAIQTIEFDTHAEATAFVAMFNEGHKHTFAKIDGHSNFCIQEVAGRLYGNEVEIPTLYGEEEVRMVLAHMKADPGMWKCRCEEEL